MSNAGTIAQAYFLHAGLMTSHAEPAARPEIAELVNRAAAHPMADAAMAQVLQPLAVQLLESSQQLEIALEAESITPGMLVTCTQAFYFKSDGGSIQFHAKSAAHPEIRLHGRLSASRVLGDTGRDLLSGQRRVSLIAHVLDVDGANVELTPLFVGQFYDSQGAPGLGTFVDRRQVWPSMIDEFSKIDMRRRPTAADLKAVRAMPESQVKQAFAELAGEVDPAADWGGERSDLYTEKLHLDGAPITAAFAFKGPAHRGTLHPRDMGKRGDRVLRLTSERADLLVVQHHDNIASTVTHLLSALAVQERCRFMVIDGVTTAALLKAYGKLT